MKTREYSWGGSDSAARLAPENGPVKSLSRGLCSGHGQVEERKKDLGPCACHEPSQNTCITFHIMSVDMLKRDNVAEELFVLDKPQFDEACGFGGMGCTKVGSHPSPKGISHLHRFLNLLPSYCPYCAAWHISGSRRGCPTFGLSVPRMERADARVDIHIE
jgi:hypothetical protein